NEYRLILERASPRTLLGGERASPGTQKERLPVRERASPGTQKERLPGRDTLSLESSQKNLPHARTRARAPDKKWDRVQLHLKLKPELVDAWFARIRLGNVVDGVGVVITPTKFIASHISTNFEQQLLDAWQVEDASVKRIRFEVAAPSRSPTQ